METLTKKVIPQQAELIEEEIYLQDDVNEENPVNVYSKKSGKEFKLYTLDLKGNVEEYKLTKNFNRICTENRHEILSYRLGKYTEEDEVCLGDIFLHGKFISKI